MTIEKTEITARGSSVKRLSPIEQLKSVEKDLAAVQTRSEQLAAAEDEARSSADAYAAWRASRAAVDVEIERLTALAASLEEPARLERERNAIEAARKRHAEKVKSNAELAKRTQDEIAKMNAIMLPLLRDLAASQAEDQFLNASLPNGLDPLIPAEFLARGRPGLPRKEIARERVWLWTKLHGGHLIGDQDAVEDRGGGNGMLQAGVSTFPCVKALFEQTTYSPTEPMERPQTLLRMQLFQGDGPGLAYDGTRLTDPRAVLSALDYATRPRATAERPIEIELRQIPAVTTVATDEVA